MEVIRNNMAARQTDLRLYLDVFQEGQKVRSQSVYQQQRLLTLLGVVGNTPRFHNDLLETFRCNAPKLIRYREGVCAEDRQSWRP